MVRDICVVLGKRIRQLVTARSWRQIDLAEQAGIKALASALGLTVSEFLNPL